MIISILTLTLGCVVYGYSLDWKERDFGKIVYSEPENTILERARCISSQDEFCRNNQDLANGILGHFLKKKTPRNPAKIFSVFQQFPHCPCTCKMDYLLMELGRQYVPRYLPTGVCKLDSCGNYHKCVEKKYPVPVIKQKDFPGQELPETKVLPSSLKDSWTSDSVNVSMACECVPIM